MKPELSIITVNYNGFADTCEMIDSLKKHLSFSYELIVVDNASICNQAGKIQEIYPDPFIKYIRSEKNLGFAGGNNLGLRQAEGRYILLLNNDTLLIDNTLVDLMKVLDENEQIGAVSPKLKFASIPDEIQFAGYTDLSPVTLRNQTLGYGEKDNGQYDTPGYTYFLHGAAMMVRSDAVKKAGLMPELYFLYYEEYDWCQHIKDAGYKLWYQPSCTIFHKESKSVGAKSPLKIFYMTRNRLLYAWRNLKGLNRILSVAYQLAIALPKNAFTQLLSGRQDLFKSSFQGACAFFSIKDKMIKYK